MKCERDYTTDKIFCADFGGVDAMKQLITFAGTLVAPSCPFCGGDAYAHLSSVYGHPAAQIVCGRCRCQTMLFTSGEQIHFTDDGSFEWLPVSIEDCLKNALERWSKRVRRKSSRRHRKAAVSRAPA